MIKKLIAQTSGSGNIYSLAGNLIFALFSFVTFLIMVRLLDKAMFGHWVVFVTMASLLDMLRLGLTGTATIRLISTLKGEDKKKVIGTSYQLGALTTGLISVILIVSYVITVKIFPQSYYLPVLLFYPILALVNLPFNQANVIAQGEVDFKRVLILRTVNGLLIFCSVMGYILLSKVSLQGIIMAYILANLGTSFLTVVMGWDGLKYIGRSDKNIKNTILHFGKFSTASYIGSNLLRSSDTIILSLAPSLA
jgi:O-antigen/teichoic acid export membrane protein